MKQLGNRDVAAVLARKGYRLPINVDQSSVARWHRGLYYGYGRADSWVPLNHCGGIATKPFHAHRVKFPREIDRALSSLLRRSA